MQFKGTKVLANKFNRASDKGVDNLLSLFDEEAAMIEKRALRDVPVKTGRLRASFFKRNNSKGNVKNYVIGFSQYYAAYKEFGTGKGLRIDGEYSEFNNYAYTFKTTNYPENYTRQKKYLLNAFILSRRSINKKSFTAIKNLIK